MQSTLSGHSFALRGSESLARSESAVSCDESGRLAALQGVPGDCSQCVRRPRAFPARLLTCVKLRSSPKGRNGTGRHLRCFDRQTQSPRVRGVRGRLASGDVVRRSPQPAASQLVLSLRCSRYPYVHKIHRAFFVMELPGNARKDQYKFFMDVARCSNTNRYAASQPGPAL